MEDKPIVENLPHYRIWKTYIEDDYEKMIAIFDERYAKILENNACKRSELSFKLLNQLDTLLFKKDVKFHYELLEEVSKHEKEKIKQLINTNGKEEIRGAQKVIEISEENDPCTWTTYTLYILICTLKYCSQIIHELQMHNLFQCAMESTEEYGIYDKDMKCYLERGWCFNNTLIMCDKLLKRDNRYRKEDAVYLYDWLDIRECFTVYINEGQNKFSNNIVLIQKGHREVILLLLNESTASIRIIYKLSEDCKSVESIKEDSTLSECIKRYKGKPFKFYNETSDKSEYNLALLLLVVGSFLKYIKSIEDGTGEIEGGLIKICEIEDDNTVSEYYDFSNYILEREKSDK